MLIQREALVSSVTFVSREEFVTSVARKQCGHAGYARQAGTVVSADGGRVGEGLVVIVHDFWDSVVGITRSEAEFVVVRAEMLRRGASESDFAVNRLSKENRVGVDGRMALVHEGNNAAAIGASTQVSTSLLWSEIGQMALDRGAHAFADLAGPVRNVAIAALAILEIPVAGLANLTGFIRQAKPGAQFLDSLIDHHRGGDSAEKHILHECGRIHRSRRFLSIANSSHSRSEKKAIAFLAPVKTIYAETIDGENEAAALVIPKSKGENAIQ